MIFAIYDLEDNLIAVLDNYKELCNFFKKTIKSMQCAVCRFSQEKIDSIISNDDRKKYKVYKIKGEW